MAEPTTPPMRPSHAPLAAPTLTIEPRPAPVAAKSASLRRSRLKPTLKAAPASSTTANMPMPAIDISSVVAASFERWGVVDVRRIVRNQARVGDDAVLVEGEDIVPRESGIG